ncbi:MAG: hypothetical protein ACYC23_24225 [Limisphaerales bacterium]
MPLYEMRPDAFRPIRQASFADLKVRERDDLQRLLRTQIDVLGDELYIDRGEATENKRIFDPTPRPQRRNREEDSPLTSTSR